MPSVPSVLVWFAIAAVVALVLGICAGVLGWVSGQHPAAAVLTGGAAFGAVLTLEVVVINSVPA